MFRLEEEPDMSSGSIVFDSKGGDRRHKASGKMSIAKKMCKEVGGELVQSSSYNNSSSGGQAAEDGNQAEPHLEEEDYIVFCFREDGAIRIINEGKSSEAYEENDDRENITTTAATLRPISRKVSRMIFILMMHVLPNSLHENFLFFSIFWFSFLSIVVCVGLIRTPKKNKLWIGD